LRAILQAGRAGHALTETDIVRLFSVEGRDLDAVIAAADQLRHDAVGDTVTYVVNRNINYTNICLYHCGFCAFSKGRGSKDLRGPAYRLDLDEVARRTAEAAAAGATEVCLQGGIHPEFTGATYLDIVRAVKQAVPWMHVHAFSPLEVQHGASTLALPLAAYLERLREAGLSSLPGTAAEILDDEIRDIICPDKLRTHEWLNVLGTAHEVGLRTTATIMFGHVESPVHWARHLLRLRALQERTGGITEFVPLGYVHMEAPLWRKGRTRSGPSFREAILMHAVPRLALNPLIRNIQTSWVKMGARGAAVCLDAGANDLGGTLMSESITRAAGGVHGQALDAAQLEALAGRIGRPARQRTTLYGTPGEVSPARTVSVHRATWPAAPATDDVSGSAESAESAESPAAAASVSISAASVSISAASVCISAACAAGSAAGTFGRSAAVGTAASAVLAAPAPAAAAAPPVYPAAASAA
jgi:FO synthase